jgi:CubicO group peptidase (beta-lactamase class C family)
MSDDKLANLLARHASAHGVPGAALGIVREGAVRTAFYGTADVRTLAPVTDRSRFRVGSLTKSMVATVIARLAQAGTVSFQDAVAAHVPELRGIAWAQRATIKDLMANRSRIPLTDDLEGGFDARSHYGDDALSRLAREVAAQSPAADHWSYSNAGWSLLGRVIEAATGDSWENVTRELLLAPTGMSDTTFGQSPQLVSGHELTPEGAVPAEPLAGRAYGPAGTSIASTVDDLLRFARVHLEDPALEPLRAVQERLAIHGWFDSWCLGWGWFDWPGADAWGWDGVVSGERSVLRLIPSRQAAVVLLTNSGTGRAAYRSLFADLMPAEFGIDPPPLRLGAQPDIALDFSKYAGTYAWPDLRIDVVTTQRGLLLADGEGETEALPVDKRTFVIDPADPDRPTITFGGFDSTGRPHVLYRMLWGLSRAND